MYFVTSEDYYQINDRLWTGTKWRG